MFYSRTSERSHIRRLISLRHPIRLLQSFQAFARRIFARARTLAFQLRLNLRRSLRRRKRRMFHQRLKQLRPSQCVRQRHVSRRGVRLP